MKEFERIAINPTQQEIDDEEQELAFVLMNNILNSNKRWGFNK